MNGRAGPGTDAKTWRRLSSIDGDDTGRVAGGQQCGAVDVETITRKDMGAMGCRPDEVRTMICKGCGRRVLRYKRWDDYCRSAKCQARAATEEFIAEKNKKRARLGRLPLENAGDYRKRVRRLGLEETWQQEP